MKIKKILFLWLPVVVWSAVIFTLSSIKTLPTQEIYWWDFVLKKTAHVVEYAILYFLVFRAINKADCRLKEGLAYDIKIGKTTLRPQDWLIPFVLTLFYAFSDEYHQSFVPGRHCKLMDIGFDSLGMVLSFWQIKKHLA